MRLRRLQPEMGMLFGHNSNVTVAGTTYHVQTEERGLAHAQIDTTVYFRGHVLHRRTSNYRDLLPLSPDREETLRLRVEKQHHRVVDEIRSGKLRLPARPEEHAQASTNQQPVAASPNPLQLQLLNAKTWLAGKHAHLQILVQDHANNPVEHAAVTAKVEGAAQPAVFCCETGSLGHAQFEFEMPRLAGPEAALVIEASSGKCRAHLRFQLRSKPRVPTTS